MNDDHERFQPVIDAIQSYIRDTPELQDGLMTACVIVTDVATPDSGRALATFASSGDGRDIPEWIRDGMLSHAILSTHDHEPTDPDEEE